MVRRGQSVTINVAPGRNTPLLLTNLGLRSLLHVSCHAILAIADECERDLYEVYGE